MRWGRRGELGIVGALEGEVEGLKEGFQGLAIDGVFGVEDFGDGFEGELGAISQIFQGESLALVILDFGLSSCCVESILTGRCHKGSAPPP